MRLANTRILVLGASGGIGTELTAQLVTAGAAVLACGRDQDALDALNVCHGDAVEPVACDITTSDGRAKLYRFATSAPLDAIVSLVGVNHFGTFAGLRSEDLEQVLQSSLLAPMLVQNMLLPHLIASGAAPASFDALARAPIDSANRLIVNVGSVFGHIGYAGNAAYCAAKFGLRGFSEALGRELASSRVRVLHIAPRATRTPFNDANVQALNDALGQAQDSPATVARAIVMAMQRERVRSVVGMPERFFAWLNAVAPALVGRALHAKLPLILQHATHNGDRPCQDTATPNPPTTTSTLGARAAG